THRSPGDASAGPSHSRPAERRPALRCRLRAVAHARFVCARDRARLRLAPTAARPAGSRRTAAPLCCGLRGVESRHILGPCVSGRSCSRCCSGSRGAATSRRRACDCRSRSSDGSAPGCSMAGSTGRSTGGAPETFPRRPALATVTRSGQGRAGGFLIALAVALAALLAHPGGGPARATGRTDVRILVQPPSTFDPAAQGDVATAAVTAQLYETLTTYDGALQLEPALARSWDVAA